MAAPARKLKRARYVPDPQTWDHVVRAAAHCGQLEAAAVLMRLCREHAHDPELLARTRGVRGKLGVTLLMRAVERCDVARAAEIVGACPTPASRAELLACVDSRGWTALHQACSRNRENAAVALVDSLLDDTAEAGFHHAHLQTSGHDIQLARGRKGQWGLRIGKLAAAGPQAGAAAEGAADGCPDTDNGADDEA